jgi:hypothetical protein
MGGQGARANPWHVACSEHLVFWRDATAADESAEQLVPGLAALTQFTCELDVRLAGVGLGGLQGVVDLHQRLRAVLDGATLADLERMTTLVASVQRDLVELDRRLAELRSMKAFLDRVDGK